MTPRFLSTRAQATLTLLLLASITLFFGLGRIALVGSDEPRYAEVAREMWSSGDYVSPRLAGRLWLEKAPLLYWGQALFYSIFGATELAARLPSACGALFIVLMLRSTARRAFGGRVALYVAIVAATMAAIVVTAHGGSTDMPLCAMFTGAFLCLWRSAYSPTRSFLWALGAGAFVGGAMLAKALIGPLFFLGIGGIWWLWARPDQREGDAEIGFVPRSFSQRSLTFLAAFVVFLAISAIWYWPVWMRHGQFFWDEFIINQHFKRFGSNKYKHPQPFYYYLTIAPLLALPWTPWLFAAFGNLRTLRPRLSQRDSLLALSWVWAIVPIAFFSISGSKLPFYMLPSAPAFAILAGEALSRGVWLPRAWKPKWVALGGAGLMVMVVLFLFLVYAPRNEAKLSSRALSLKVAAAMKPGERATFLGLGKEYTPVFYLQGRIVPGVGQPNSENHDTFVADTPAQLVPVLRKEKGSLIVFCKAEEAALLEKNAAFTAQRLGSQRNISAYRLTLKLPLMP